MSFAPQQRVLPSTFQIDWAFFYNFCPWALHVFPIPAQPSTERCNFSPQVSKQFMHFSLPILGLLPARLHTGFLQAQSSTCLLSTINITSRSTIIALCLPIWLTNSNTQLFNDLTSAFSLFFTAAASFVCLCKATLLSCAGSASDRHGVNSSSFYAFTHFTLDNSANSNGPSVQAVFSTTHANWNLASLFLRSCIKQYCSPCWLHFFSKCKSRLVCASTFKPFCSFWVTDQPFRSLNCSLTDVFKISCCMRNHPSHYRVRTQVPIIIFFVNIKDDDENISSSRLQFLPHNGCIYASQLLFRLQFLLSFFADHSSYSRHRLDILTHVNLLIQFCTMKPTFPHLPLAHPALEQWPKR